MCLFAFWYDCISAPNAFEVPSFDPALLNCNLVCDDDLYRAPDAETWYKRISETSLCFGINLRAVIIRLQDPTDTTLATLNSCALGIVTSTTNIINYMSMMNRHSSSVFFNRVLNLPKLQLDDAEGPSHVWKTQAKKKAEEVVDSGSNTLVQALKTREQIVDDFEKDIGHRQRLWLSMLLTSRPVESFLSHVAA